MARPFLDARLAIARNRHQLRGPAKQKLLDWLEAWDKPVLRLSNDQIAAAAGVSRPTVARVMRLLYAWKVLVNTEPGGGCVWKLIDGVRIRVGRAARRIRGQAFTEWRRFRRALDYRRPDPHATAEQRQARAHGRRGPPPAPVSPAHAPA